MARPRKNNAEYFSHDADMRNSPRIKALRRTFKTNGYAVWNFLLEVLTDSDFFELEWSAINIEIYAGDFDVAPDELTQIVDYCLKIGLLQTKKRDAENSENTVDILTCEKLKERLSCVVEKRAKFRKTEDSDNENHSGSEFQTQESTDSGVSDAETPQTKLNKTKRNNIKEINNSLSMFESVVVTDEERENFFEIFFFKNYKNVSDEVDRFIDHYSAADWKRANGQRATNKTALAKTWEPKNKEKSCGRINEQMLHSWQKVYNVASQKNRAVAKMLITDLFDIKKAENKLIFICTEQFRSLIESNVEFFKPLMLQNFGQGIGVAYRYPNNDNNAK